MKDAKELTEDEIERIVAQRERDFLYEEINRFIDENRAEIIKRTQERIRKDIEDRKQQG